MTPQQQQIIEKCKQVVEKVRILYNMDLSNVLVRFDLKGRSAGMASRRSSTYYVRFNADMLTRDAFSHVINDTVPHEYAHIVCFMNPNLGRNHDAGWARVCEQLGGSGARCHKEEVVFGKGTTYEYTATCGNKVRVSQVMHSRIQAGKVYVWKNHGEVNKNCAYSVVGVQGKTLAQPIIRTPAAPAPAALTTPAAVIKPVAPVARPVIPVQPKKEVFVPEPGQSKASVSRTIIAEGYKQ